MPVGRLSLCLLCLLGTMSLVRAESQQAYGERLEGFAYPYPVASFDFVSQRQKLTMAYMDVAPATEQANGRTAVLFHGKNFCGATWGETIARLSAAGFRVVVPDQIGFCRSSKPHGYTFSFNQLSTNTQALLASLGIERITLIGHSMGGMLATRFALSFPGHVEQLVLVNPLGLEDWQAKGVPPASIDALYGKEIETTAASIKAYQQRMYYAGQWQPRYDLWTGMLAGMYAGPGREIVAWNQAQTSAMIFEQPVVHEFERLSVPTVLMIGMKDRTAPGANRAAKDLADKLGDYPALAEGAKARIANARLIAFGSMGHAPHIEEPGIFHAALIEALLNR